MKKKAAPKPEAVDPAFLPLVEYHMKTKGVTHATLFNSKSLCWNRKVFSGKPFDPGTGKVMKEWVAIPAAHKKQWLAISKRARSFVSS